MKTLTLLLLTTALWAQSAPLKERPVPEGQFVLGAHVSGTIPTDCLTLRSKLPVCFFDLNGDGKLSTDGADGIGLADERLIAPLGPSVLLPEGQFSWTFTADTVEMTPEETGLEPRQVAECAVLTRLRIRAGLPTATLDPVSVDACQKHLAYLALNPMQRGMELHDEHEGRPGYTPEGVLAAKRSSMAGGVTTLDAALLKWYRGAWHGWPLVDPGIVRFGAACANQRAMFYFSGRAPASAPLVHPADGSSNIPVSFAPGEIPSPVAGTVTGSLGYPIYRKDGATGASVVVEKHRSARLVGQEIEGTWSTRAEPSTPKWPSNSGLSLFIPAKALPRQAMIKVTWTLADGSTEAVRFATE